jgi:hypothetical protein
LEEAGGLLWGGEAGGGGYSSFHKDLNVWYQHTQIEEYSSIPFYSRSITEYKTSELNSNADRSGRAVYCVDLRPLAYWACGFEFRQRHGCLCLVNVVCCQVEISASG